MIARNYVDGAGHELESVGDINHKLSTNAIVFKSIARKDQKIGRFLSAYLGNASTRVQSGCAYPIADATNLCGSHANLPVARMHKPHTVILRHLVAHGMSYLENFFSTG
jgi:hypothetical protein